MKVAIIGVGGVGRTLAQLLRAETAIDSLLLIDKEENRVRFFTKMMGRVEVDAGPFRTTRAGRAPGNPRAVATARGISRQGSPGPSVHGPRPRDVQRPGEGGRRHTRFHRRDSHPLGWHGTDSRLRVGHLPVVLAGNVPFGHALAPLRVVRRLPSRTGAAERLGRLRVPAPRRRPTHVPRQSRGGEDPSPVPRQAGPAGRFQTSVPSRVNPSRVVFENPGAPGRGPENLDRLGAGSFSSSVSPSAAGTVSPRASGRWREGAERGSRGNGRRHAQGRASRHRDGPPRGGEAGRNHSPRRFSNGPRRRLGAPYWSGRRFPRPRTVPPPTRHPRSPP